MENTETLEEFLKEKFEGLVVGNTGAENSVEDFNMWYYKKIPEDFNQNKLIETAKEFYIKNEYDIKDEKLSNCLIVRKNDENYFVNLTLDKPNKRILGTVSVLETEFF